MDELTEYHLRTIREVGEPSAGRADYWSLRRRVNRLYVNRLLKNTKGKSKKKAKMEFRFVPARDWKTALEDLLAPNRTPAKDAKAKTLSDDALKRIDLHTDTFGILRAGYIDTLEPGGAGKS